MNRIEEPAREGFLYHLWLERSFNGRQLQDTNGQRIEILEKGVRNRDAGPDFLAALLKINGRLVRGDVEIHAVAGDWYAHGHHRDPRYNNVVLHVVTMDCPPAFRTVKENGLSAATLNLDDYLEKSAELLETERSEEQPPVELDCALRNETALVIRAVVERAGDLRLLSKAARFGERPAAQSWDQVFYEFLMEALGYAKNRVPFRKLAVLMPIETLWRYTWNDPEDLAGLKCEALLFGAAGLLPLQNGIKIEDGYIADLEAWWRTLSHRGRISSLRAEEWQFFRLRPFNFPTRRIAAAAALVCRFREQGFMASFTRAFADQNSPAKIIRELETMVMVDARPFWCKRYTFEEETESGERQLLGSERAGDIVVNTILPALFAFAEESDDGKLKNGVHKVYHNYPRLSSNDLIRQMQQRLFSGLGERAGMCGARHQQGLIHLHKEWCRAGECRECLALAGSV